MMDIKIRLFTLDTLELKKMTIYILSLKSNGLHTYKLKSL